MALSKRCRKGMSRWRALVSSRPAALANRPPWQDPSLASLARGPLRQAVARLAVAEGTRPEDSEQGRSGFRRPARSASLRIWDSAENVVTDEV